MKRLFAIAAVCVLAGGLFTACDSGVAPGEAVDPAPPTLSFQEPEIAITEESGTVEITAVLTNPPSNEVTAEILYANGDSVSSTEPSDFNLPADAAVNDDGTAYVAGTVTFPVGAESGATQTISLPIQDADSTEDQEEGIFVFQNVTGGATVSPDEQLAVKLGAIQIFAEDFADDALDPMTAISVASSNDWGTSTAGGADNVPYAVANGFGGSEPANDWLITPALNFNNFEGETLSFLNATNFDDGGLPEGVQEALLVKVSTDYDGSSDPTASEFTWIDISDQVTYSEGGFNFVSSGEIDLRGDQFQGEEVYIAFQYISSGTGPGTSEAWEVDNIVVTGK
ncbi:choice-of-anchor J domain-containing protein [Salisaeta longa]|uniref:choice-of-anchor J domain-containing protein n=1 Tax=Salisaeta longa TaxID=503170 RepID=UPI0012FB3C69|nr:choice-of-anchor J domain-containing protein [Salisaeta longa]